MDIREINEIIIKLYLYMVSTKKIHYSCKAGHTHELCDTLFEDIKEFTDEFAEQFYGYIGKPNYNTFKDIDKVKIKEEDNIVKTCDNILALITYAQTKINKEKKLSNITSLIDDFKGKLNKTKFLSTFDKHSKI